MHMTKLRMMAYLTALQLSNCKGSWLVRLRLAEEVRGSESQASDRWAMLSRMLCLRPWFAHLRRPLITL
jgi:hypothetical protein